MATRRTSLLNAISEKKDNSKIPLDYDIKNAEREISFGTV